MRKFDACVGHEARINKLLLKKPPGIMSADNASSVCGKSTNEPLKATRRREIKDSKKQKLKNADGGRRRTWSPTLRRRIFVDGLRSMGSARVGYPMHLTDDTLHQSGLGQ